MNNIAIILGRLVVFYIIAGFHVFKRFAEPRLYSNIYAYMITKWRRLPYWRKGKWRKRIIISRLHKTALILSFHENKLGLAEEKPSQFLSRSSLTQISLFMTAWHHPDHGSLGEEKNVADGFLPAATATNSLNSYVYVVTYSLVSSGYRVDNTLLLSHRLYGSRRPARRRDLYYSDFWLARRWNFLFFLFS